MTSCRRFCATDLFRFNNMYAFSYSFRIIFQSNLDPLTETYNLSFYLGYLARWPDYFYLAEAPNGDLMGYIMGKAEGKGKNWHGHVTALTVAPEYRRIGLAKSLMQCLEEVSEKIYNGYFVDLFVRESNKLAIGMYEKMGYSVYRRVLKYYSAGGPSGEEEDAFDMRKALPRDVNKESIIPLPYPVSADEVS